MMQVFFLLLILFSLTSLHHTADIKFYWLAATPQCNKSDMFFREFLRQYGIIQNTNAHNNGEYVVQAILEPMIEPWINGSITEDELRASECFQESFEYFKLSLSETPENFTGLGMINLRSQIEFIVNKNLGKYVQLLMTESLQYAKSRWPKALWAYENLLYCEEKNRDGKLVCGSQTQYQRFAWLWELQDVIVPQLVFNSEYSNTENLRLVTEELHEAKRITENHHVNSTKIIPALLLTNMSSLLQPQQASDFHYEIDVLKKIVDIGVDKVFLTANYDFFKNKRNCEQFHSYLQNIVGPALNATLKYKRRILWPVGPMFSYSYTKFAIQGSNSESAYQPLQILILSCICVTLVLIIHA